MIDYTPYLEYKFYDSQAAEKFNECSRLGMAATFIYSGAVYSNGTRSVYDEDNSRIRTVAVGGVSFAPARLFTNFLGVSAEICDGECTLCHNGRSLKLHTGAREYTLDGERGELSTAVFSKEGEMYLPIIETAKLLGFAAKAYYEDRLTAVGSSAAIEMMDSDPKIAEAGAYMILGKYDTASFTAEDFKAARNNWKIKIVGSPELNDLSNPAIAEKVKAISNACRTSWERMHKNEDTKILFGDHLPVESVELARQYGGLRNMAKGWGTYGSEFYHNEQLRRDIIWGVRWMYENMYGEAEIAGTGWRDAHLFNWYYWFVDAPDFLCDIFFILEDAFTLEEKKTYLKCFYWVCTFMRKNFSREMALSRIWTCTKAALALEDRERLYAEYVDFDMLLGLTELDEGPRIDYTQWTHGFPYNMGYGKLNLDRVFYVASALRATPLEFTNPKQYNHFMLIKYMYEPAIYNGRGFMMLNGRNTKYTETGFAGSAMAYMLAMIGFFGDDEDAYLKHFIKRNCHCQKTVDTIKAQGTIQDCVTFFDLMNDPAVSGEQDYEYAHAWFTGDRAVQQRNNYAIGIALTTKREFFYESINDQNKQGWYTGDGATYLYTDYDDESFDGDNFLEKNIEVAYRFPGTTEDMRERVVRSIHPQKAYRPSNSFGSSLQFEDKYITAAMDFESLNFEGPEEDFKDIGYGGAQPVHRNDLRARKAWFCFDDEIVCLGAGITSTMDSPVNTTLEHKRIMRDRDLSQKICSDGKVTLLPKENFEISREQCDWLLMEGHAGYCFLGGADVCADRYVCESAGGQSFFEARIRHGKNPVDATYAYAIIPYATEEKMQKYSSAPDVDILSNTARVQAVAERGLGISSFVFYEAGECCGIKVSAPAIVMLKKKDGRAEIAVTDPTRELSRITVTLDGAYTLTEANPKMKISTGASEAVIDIDLELSNGRPFRAKLDIV